MVSKTSELEKKVAKIFQLTGFKVKHNANLGESKAELLASVEKFSIVCKFKYEHTEEEVRDLIVEWAKKKEEIKASKIVIVVSGIEVLGEDREMAGEHNIIIWEEDNIHEFLSLLNKEWDERKDEILKFLQEMSLPYENCPDILEKLKKEYEASLGPLRKLRA